MADRADVRRDRKRKFGHVQGMLFSTTLENEAWCTDRPEDSGAQVHGFLPYFYIQRPHSSCDPKQYRDELNRKLIAKKGDQLKNLGGATAVCSRKA